MRTRTRDMRTLTYFYKRADTTSGLPVNPPYNADWSNPSAYDGNYETISDENHGRRRVGIVMGPLDLYKSTRSHTDGELKGTVPEWGETWTHRGDMIDGIESSLTFPSITGDAAAMSQIALIKAYAEMKRSSIMSGEVLSDLGRTVGMLKHPFRSSQQLIRKMNLRKLKYLKKSGSNAAQAISNAWLEHRFGWQPIFNDIATIVIDAKKIKATMGEKNLVARATERNTGRFQVPFAQRNGGGQFSSHRYTGSATSTQEVSASAGIIYDLASRSKADSAEQVLGTRTMDIVPLVWEKIPYSFVVDRFVNVGDWLQAVTPDPFITVKRSWTTYVIRESRDYSATAEFTVKTTSPQRKLTGSAGSSTWSYVHVVRVIDPQLSITPVLTLKPLSTLQQADHMALTAGAILRSLKEFKSSR